ncbi:carboxypeptidase-like regulatory domain-containing protein [uncultured Alistipes sp.]|uniref:carboxypeptidase-like regulatory domain-containing protein n=1 Tax=uncultured Alistipes sp. TaxID=538949 RepID=UPI002586AB41|nr:carboxypeptidase-like regulatory domain-containing protein [uncultured Alistipes sp.]
MKLKVLLILMLAAVTFTSYAQDGGIRGKVVSRNGRVALSNVQVKIESLGLAATTDKDGNFIFENLPAGSYTVLFSTPEFEDLSLMVRVGNQHVQDLKSVIIVPSGPGSVLDDAVFAEFDSDSSSSDTQALPSSLSSSKDLFNNIASYRFSEMRFNVRGYDSQYSDIYLNGIRFNDAMTGYGPWSLWSGLNDATRNQENYTGLQASDFGIGGIGGMTNINARASQMRKGFRVSVSNGNQMYRFRAMVSYGSGQLDNGWSYAFSVGTRQGGNGYVDGVYYNSYSYFASAEKLFGQNHRLALTLLASPSERGAQQASTDEAYRLFGNNYYNPNVGYQAGKLRNSRVRNTHEPIVMLNYTWDMSGNTRLNAATSLRFGKNGYSALTWNGGSDPRADYYRFMPTSDFTQVVPGITTDETIYNYGNDAVKSAGVWTGMIDYDELYNRNQFIETLPEIAKLMGNQYRSNYMIEERHTDQLDYNFAANVEHNMRNNMRIVGGVNLRVNRTNYYSQVKDLMGGDYWYDIDKFAERDMASVEAAQNDLDYYWATGHARIARRGDKYGYYYRAHLLETNAWANYTWAVGGFSLGVAGSVGYSNMYREGMWRKGLFPNDSKGDSKKLDYLTYEGKLSLGYKFSGAHSIEANVAYMQQAPKFSTAFVSPRTRNTTTPGLKAEKVFAADLTYNLNLPYVKARLSGYYTTIEDQSKVISFYDDTRSSFTNFAMSGIDKRHYGVELGLSVPVWQGLSVVGALSWGDYTYTSNPNFVQTVDNIDKIVLKDKVNWDGYHVESSPQMAFNIGLDYRGPRNWFAGVNFNYYDNLYLSMNPMYRTATAVKYYANVLTSNTATNDQKAVAIASIKKIRAQEKFDGVYTLSANVGKNWYIHRVYMLGFSLEVKNILNDQDIRTGGYEQMRMSKVRGTGGEQIYGRFPSKYFYLFGTTYYLNVYFRF